MIFPILKKILLGRKILHGTTTILHGMKIFILSASAAFWHKIGKGCNVDIIMIEVEKGGGKVDCTF